MTRQTSTESVVSVEDIAQMAKILREKYGEKAVEVADVLIRDHVQAQDKKRAAAWVAVSRYLCDDKGFSISLH
ncbi:MAG: hypothetical protein JKY32_04005 [Rhizobiales bacterium]|nr:hypothetical protein [Hyphomicrobiales bacterium]